MKKLVFMVVLAGSLIACQKQGNEKVPFIDEKTIAQAIDSMKSVLGETELSRYEKSVRQVAALWRETDGQKEDFISFCKTSYISDSASRFQFFQKLSGYFESIWGLYNKMSQELRMAVDVDQGDLTEIDELFGAYTPSAHLTEDLFQNKIAFKVILNFPFYSLEEKQNLGKKWSRLEWAYARMGDLFTSRVPADLLMKAAEAQANADLYISSYNIYMGRLIDDFGKTLFPEDLKLITHWGLRDEIKSNYSNPEGLARQKMIYEVMKRIIDQSIPVEVINKKNLLWNPYSNRLLKDGKEISGISENNIRYRHLLNNFKALKAMDPFNPQYPTYIKRNFDEGMELTIDQVESMFKEMCSSQEFKETAGLISKRLGRKLEPFDIWYDGFKTRSNIPAEVLNETVRKKYPSREVFKASLPQILRKLDFSPDMAEFITSKIEVDASRGAGHAWGSEMKSEKARLRTRFEPEGMNYKGYNIAIHEFGHNVEQTISLHQVDYYILHGVPSTAFTEALAFIFQKRDLELLGIKNDNPLGEYMETLDVFWSTIEIMGVSLVDMKVWRWLYDHPDATADQLKNAVIESAKKIWNDYFASVFGIKDQPILAIYSHMIDYPLYLSAYPIGHLIDFQIEKQIKGKKFADEIIRIYSYGRTIPQLWMMHATGNELSSKPMLEAAKEALQKVKNL